MNLEAVLERTIVGASSCRRTDRDLLPGNCSTWNESRLG